LKTYNITTTDGLLLSTAIFEAEKPKAMIQIIHGAKEHKERYYDFITYLTEHGYHVIISDTRGHGASINDAFPLGYMDGFSSLIEDQYTITTFIKQQYPCLPLYLIGHSLGSIIARGYLQKHDTAIEKLILIGTANYIPIVPLGMLLGKGITTMFNKHGYNKLLGYLNFDKGDDTWISASQTNLIRYRKDPLCQFTYQNNAIVTIFEADYNLKQYRKYNCLNPTLPILSLSGQEDPITGGKKGLLDTIKTLHKIGYYSITYKEYPHMRHEILNEDDKHLVYQDILTWL
jgi:alpha-beta hydrolase superfamily lysophospholipase